MHPADIVKTAIITLFGLFKFLRLTFRLRNAGSTFQRLMNQVLAGLAFAFIYLDDIIIASPPWSSISRMWRTFSGGYRRPAWSSTSRSAPSPCRKWIS